MLFGSKIKWAVLGGLILSFVSLVVHLFLAKYSTPDLLHYSALTVFSDDINLGIGVRQIGSYRKMWGTVKSLHSLQPFSNARAAYPEPHDRGNHFIYAKISGGFGKIRTFIPDLVVVARLLNVALVIPEIQESSHLNGIRSVVCTCQNLRPDISCCCPSTLASIMKRCCDENPDKRPDMDEIVSLLEAIDTSKGGGMILANKASQRCFCFGSVRGP